MTSDLYKAENFWRDTWSSNTGSRWRHANNAYGRQFRDSAVKSIERTQVWLTVPTWQLTTLCEFPVPGKKVPPLALEGTRNTRGTQASMQPNTYTHKYNKLKMEKVHIRSVGSLGKHFSVPKHPWRYQKTFMIQEGEHLHRACFLSRKWYAVRPCMTPRLGRIFPECLKGFRIRLCPRLWIRAGHIPTVLCPFGTKKQQLSLERRKPGVCAQTNLTTAASLCLRIYLLIPLPPPLEAHLSCVTFSTTYCPLLKWHISYIWFFLGLLPCFCGMCLRFVKWTICLSFNSLVSGSTEELKNIGKHNYFREKEWDFKGSLNIPIKPHHRF